MSALQMEYEKCFNYINADGVEREVLFKIVFSWYGMGCNIKRPKRQFFEILAWDPEDDEHNVGINICEHDFNNMEIPEIKYLAKTARIILDHSEGEIA